ncbi:hypothetical protein [Pararhodobacter sp. SW119]|uniref:hypothetical protein n=1 Tax=Pararhodobacter sp. SW119 TaxID=2780075 RepID=UPI001ADF666B|nr:hypothetical protein [Pararhodobacter sp. SW119]
MTPDDQTHATQIRRRSDGTIDFDHYEAIARRLRAEDQRKALARMEPPIARLLRAVGSQPSARIRALFGS